MLALARHLRWQQNGIFASSLTFNGNNNRIDGATYDASGNMLNDGSGGHTFTYDAENRITSVTSSSGTSTYSYDANGNRVHRTGYNGTTCAPGVADYVFDLQGRWILQVNSSTTACAYEIYAGSRHVGSNRGGVVFSHTDWLGTERVRINYAYANNRYYDEHCASLPFGDDLGPCTAGSYSSPLHFTGKERDSESGLDNFGARYNSSAMGRFMSADPKHVSTHLSDPQSLNRYAYARNNPLLYVDPDGKDFEKAAQDLKTFVKSIYIKVSIGVGYEAKVKVGAVEGKVGAAYKATAETSQDAILKVSRSAEAGASAGPTNGPKAGENISAEQTVLTVNKDGTLTGAEKPTVTVTDTIGGNTSVNSSPEQIGLGLEAPLGPEPIVGGAEVGTTREGLGALKDAASEVKNSLTNPGPPPPPKPPTPPCSTSPKNKCPN